MVVTEVCAFVNKWHYLYVSVQVQNFKGDSAIYCDAAPKHFK
jgi:hypothetical protein